MTDLVLVSAVRVLHAFIGRDGSLGLWAETDKPGTPGRGLHPFALPAPALPSGDRRAPATLLLPSTSAGPLPSPQLGLGPRRGTPRLRAWQVPAVTVPYVDDDVADEFDGRPSPALRWLIDFCGYAAALVRRGRVLPAVDAHLPAARWRPVITGPDVSARAGLLRRMPAAVRAERARPGDTAGLPAEEAFHTALDRLVDGLVRTRLAEAGVDLGPGWPGALTGEPEFTAAPALAADLAAKLDTWHSDAVSGAAVRLCFRLGRLDDPVMDELAAAEGGAAAAAAAEGGAATSAGGATTAEGGAATVEGGAAAAEGGGAAAEGRGAAVEGGAFAAETPEGGWVLEFLLQAVDEPSALVTAADIWRDRYAPLRRWTGHPQERLLGGLGRAARLFPELGAALRVPRPVDMVLDTAGAHQFLSHAGLLAEAGYGVLLPKWWRERRGLGLSLHVRPRDPSTPVLKDEAADLAHLVDYRWGLALGGRTLTEVELTELARAKVPLVRLRGRWIYLEAEHLDAGLRFLARGGGSMTAGDALRTIRLLPPEELPLPVTATSGEGWLADLMAGELDQRLELLDQPEGLVGVLRSYQIRGFSWLAFLDRLGLGACLADDMGLGKTVQLLALLLHRRHGPALLICPLSVIGNWQREAARFAPSLRVEVLHGAERPAPATLTGADLVLTTYATAVRDVDELAAIGWDRVVLDEAQHVKNSASTMARAVRRLPARSRIALTGTPVENRLAELWSILDWLNPGVLASAHTFRARFAVPIERYADEDAAARLRHATRPFLLRRVKSDPGVADDLPDKRHVRHLCGLTGEQATLYRAVLDEMVGRLEEARDKFSKGIVLAGLTKLKQACVHPALLLGDGSPLPGRSGKLERLEQIVDGALADGESVLCFTQYAKFGAMLTPHLAARFGVPVRFLHGGTPRGARDQLVAGFQQDERPGVFVLSLKAGGTGLNLTAANHVIHVDRWWNPATEAQATDRAYRIGQDRDVQVHTLVCLGTLEERIDRLLADKGDLAERVVGNGESWLTTLSANELRDLMRLSPEAIVD